MTCSSLDKTDVAAGASGIACGVVRNNYFQPAMAELMAECVEVWEAHAALCTTTGRLRRARPAGAGERPGRGPRAPPAHRLPLRADPRRGGGARHMRALFADWRAPGLTVCLHEHQAGSRTTRSRARPGRQGARGGRVAREGVAVTGFEYDGSGAVTRVQTDHGHVAVEQVVVAVGPWIAQLWAMLELPDRLDVRQPDGTCRAISRCGPTGTSRRARSTSTRRGSAPRPARSRRSCTSTAAQPLHDDAGRLITDEPWGIYFKRDRGGVQGGASTGARRATISTSTPTRPARSRPASPTCGRRRCRTAWTGSTACRPHFRPVRSGGVGAFTADNFPVFDYMRPNVFVAADSNHGYKMIAVGREIARVLLGEHSSLLHPVPLRALRDRRPAPGLAQPVPLVITGLASLGVRGPFRRASLPGGPTQVSGRGTRRSRRRPARHPCLANGPAAPHPTDAAAGGPVIRSAHPPV